MQRFTHANQATLNYDDAGFGTKGRVYVHEVYIPSKTVNHTQLQITNVCVYGGRQVTTLIEFG